MEPESGKSSTTSTLGASSYLSSISCGTSRDDSLLSTGFMICFFIFATSSSEIFICESSSYRRYTFAAFTCGRSPPDMNCMHCSHESARWSNCPGMYSTANASSANGKASTITSTCGSEKTLAFAFSKTSNDVPDT